MTVHKLYTVFNALCDYFAENGHAPSLSILSLDSGLSNSDLRECLDVLRANNVVSFRRSDVFRTLRPIFIADDILDNATVVTGRDEHGCWLTVVKGRRILLHVDSVIDWVRLRRSVQLRLDELEESLSVKSTKRSRIDATWQYIKDYSEMHGYAPSIRDIAKGTSHALDTVMRYLETLENEGRIRRTPAKARSIKVLEGAMQ